FHYLSGSSTDLAKGFSLFTLYYTNLASVLIAVVFTAIALGYTQFARRFWMGHAFVVAAIMFLMYWLFQGIDHFVLSPLSQKVAHLFLFPLVAAHFFLFRPDTPARWRFVPYWTFWPSLYTFYALLRGYLTGLYPYDQANFELQGVFRVFGMVGLTILFSLVLGTLLVTWDKRWSRARDRETYGSLKDDVSHA
ncbi:Pr6Pr family membrane protein, partial [Escherichia coli]|uniref:Pr6Pr family membrane protein n=1 Tax=Escherichia coli TaxID=562 RepID=UPI00190AC01B